MGRTASQVSNEDSGGRVLYAKCGHMYLKIIFGLYKAYLSPRANHEPIIGLEKQELAELDKKFRNVILPRLEGEDQADYDLLYEWQKFMYDKGRRDQASNLK